MLKGKKWCFESVKMGLISGIFMGMLFGIALMAGWARMMRYRSAKRIAKVWIMVSLIGIEDDKCCSIYRL